MRTLTSILIITFSIVAVLFFGTADIVRAESAEGVELGQVVVMTAEVVAIDKVDRTLTLRGEAGNVVTVEVSHAARNFDQIEIGDKLRIEYYESVALYIGKHGTKPEASAGMVAARAKKGEKPAGIAVESVDVSAKVKAIDKKKRTVTLEMPDGKVAKTKVDPSIKAFDTLKVGDTIHARFTEAIAISVDKH